MSNTLLTCIVTCTLLTICRSLGVDKFIPFGRNEGDTIFFVNDDNTTSITIPLKFPFFNRLYSTIHVSSLKECDSTNPLSGFYTVQGGGGGGGLPPQSANYYREVPMH